jgi:hypothetical protein
MKTTITLLFVLGVMYVADLRCVHAAGSWAVARSPNAFAGSCYVGQPPFPDPINQQYSQILKPKLIDEKTACGAAYDLRTNDPTDATMCFAYSSDSIAECKKFDIDLTKKLP